MTVKIGVMSEDRTRQLPDIRSFEERVFARFDRLETRFDQRLDGLDRRLDGIDDRVRALEQRALDTKPIWERALAEILVVREGVEDLTRKIEVLTQDVLQVRADQRRLGQRVDQLQSPAQ